MAAAPARRTAAQDDANWFAHVLRVTRQMMLRWSSRAAEVVHAHHPMIVSRDTWRRSGADFHALMAAEGGAQTISDAFQMMLDVPANLLTRKEGRGRRR
jgi:hypothetical protein